MVNFIIEEVLIDGVSFQSSLVILCLQPELVIFTQQAPVLMHQLGDALLLVIDDGLDLLSFDVSLVVFLHVLLEIGKHVAKGGFEVVEVLLLWLEVGGEG